MAIGRPVTLTSNIAFKSVTATATAGQTSLQLLVVITSTRLQYFVMVFDLLMQMTMKQEMVHQ